MTIPCELEYAEFPRDPDPAKWNEFNLDTKDRYRDRPAPAFFIMYTGHCQNLLPRLMNDFPITRKLLEEPEEFNPQDSPDRAILEVPPHLAHAKGLPRHRVDHPGFDNLIAILNKRRGKSIYFFGWDDELAEKIVNEMDKWRTPNRFYQSYLVFKNEPCTWENVEAIERSIQRLNYCAFLRSFMSYGFVHKFGTICAHEYDTESG